MRVVAQYVSRAAFSFDQAGKAVRLLDVPDGCKIRLMDTLVEHHGHTYVFEIDDSEMARDPALRIVNCCKCGQHETVLASDPEGEFTCVKCIVRDSVRKEDVAKPETAEAKFSRLQKQFFASSLSFDDSMWVRGYLDYCKQEDKGPLAQPDNGQIPMPKPYKWRFF